MSHDDYIKFGDSYLKAQKLNKSFFDKNIDLYINGNKVKFDFKYKKKKSEEKAVDLSSFNTDDLIDMSCLYYNNLRNLVSINTSLFNTNKVKNMNYIFY